jgi:outer membrane lipoprotein-sorting protein
MIMFRTKFTPLLFLILIPVAGMAQSATDIIQQMDDKARGESSKAEITMTIIRPTWERSISMKSWSQGTEYSLILITAPARDEGTAFLKRENEIWNWVPNIGRTVKLPPSMMMQSWMGSDFTNDDLVQESSIVKDYSHEFGADSTIEGRDCYNIILTPKPEAPVVWGSISIWVTKDELIQLRTEFYDEEDYLINIMTGSDIKEFDGRILAGKLEMIPVEDPGNKTVLEYQSLEFDVDIKRNFFSVQNLKRIN